MISSTLSKLRLVRILRQVVRRTEKERTTKRSAAAYLSAILNSSTSSSVKTEVGVRSELGVLVIVDAQESRWVVGGGYVEV